MSAQEEEEAGLGREGGSHRSPPKTLFIGNNPHYLSPLWANQTESLMLRAASCRLWEVTGRRGAGDGAERWAEVAPSGLAGALVRHSFRYLTPWRPGPRLSKHPGWEELFI